MSQQEKSSRRAAPRGRAAARWDELTHAAAKVFMEKGYSGATIDDIAAELGILKGSVYHYIGSKHELLYEVVQRPFEEAVAGLRTIVDSPDPVETRIRRAIRAHVDVTDEFFPRIAIGLLVRSDLPAREHQGFQRIKEQYEELWLTLLEDGVAAGALRPDVDPRMVLFAILGMLNWTSRWYQKDGRLGPEEIADAFAELFLDGVRARPRAL